MKYREMSFDRERKNTETLSLAKTVFYNTRESFILFFFLPDTDPYCRVEFHRCVSLRKNQNSDWPSRGRSRVCFLRTHLIRFFNISKAFSKFTPYAIIRPIYTLAYGCEVRTATTSCTPKTFENKVRRSVSEWCRE